MVYYSLFTIHGLWFMVMSFGLWFVVYGGWCMVYGLWFMVYGVQFMADGVWCILHGSRFIITQDVLSFRATQCPEKPDVLSVENP